MKLRKNSGKATCVISKSQGSESNNSFSDSFAFSSNLASQEENEVQHSQDSFDDIVSGGSDDTLVQRPKTKLQYNTRRNITKNKGVDANKEVKFAPFSQKYIKPKMFQKLFHKKEI